MKKVVWMSDAPFANSGMGIQSRYAVTHLLEAGYRVTYFAWYLGEKGEKTTYKISPLHNIDIYFMGKGAFGEAPLLDALLDKIKPDVFITYGDMHMVKTVTELSLDWRDKWAHWWPVDADSFDDKWLKIIKTIPKFIATTKFGADIINKITGQTPPIIGHVVQFEHKTKNYRKTARSEFGIAADDVVFGCVARNFWRKNLHTLIRSFAEACKQKNNLKLIIHTDVAISQSGGCNITALVSQLGIKGKVFISINSVPPEDMAKLYDIMDYHVLVSYGEGFGVPIIESMLRGIPNIIPNNTTMPELVKDSGFVVPLELSGNIDTLSGKEFFGPCAQELVKTLCQSADIRHTEKYQTLSTLAKNIANQFHEKNILPKWVDFVKHHIPSNNASNKYIQPQFANGKPKALLCSMFYVPNVLGGGEYTIHELMRGLVDNGWDCKAITLYEGINGHFRTPLPYKTFIQDGVETIHCGENWYEIIDNLLRTDPPDVLITYEIFSWYSLRFLRMAKKYNIKTVMYEQFWRLITTNFDQIIEQPVSPPNEGVECSASCDLLVSNSDYMHDVFVKFLNRDCPVVYPPMNLNKNINMSTGQYITFVNPGKSKGADTVFYLADNLPQEKFLFVGAVAEEETFINIKKRTNIIYYPHTENMTSIYQQSKVILFPSIVAESFGRVPVEAMAHGIPVIARGVGAVPQNLESFAIIIERTAEDSIWLEEVKKMLKSPQKMAEIGKRGHVFVCEKFSREAQTRKFSDLLRELIASPAIPHSIHCKKILSICDSGYLGVNTALKHMHNSFLDKIYHYSIPQQLSLQEMLIDIIQIIEEKGTEILIYGGWNKEYEKIRSFIKKHYPNIKHVVNWHSPLAQIDLEGEVPQFVGCNNLLGKGMIDYIAVPHLPDANIFRQTYHTNCRWLPDTIGEIRAERLELGDNGFKIGFFALPSPRKNILVQLSAIRLLSLFLKGNKLSWPDVTLYLGNGFDRHIHYMNFLHMLDVPYKILPHFSQKQEYYNYLGTMDINVQVTFSEAFNYVCAESLALGVPCLGSKMTPALRSPVEKINQFIEKYLVVSEIDDAAAIFEKMQLFIGLSEKLKNEMKEVWTAHINVLRQRHNKAIEHFLDEIVQAK